MPENPFDSIEDPQLSPFLKGKSDQTLALLKGFYTACANLTPVAIRTTKSMISIGTPSGQVWVTQLGKNFVHIIFPFKEPYHDNLCFTKIAQVPGQQQYNHHFRMYQLDDVNEEVTVFLKRALIN
ncbi:hypothetical protein DVR12_14320 [Chitinophaga silvatica]|uniref:DUF5655 domain-containing protein n=1 Tax=Chitinophaga silvatica TaxID=2282649 RepID=A0A3E1Y8T1_9BACT|nr:hypothetical protein [Chitinophaga silvatica]RFS21828.1 hypothetical protein DVR12_14320 [Chitinophaga silvatica]